MTQRRHIPFPTASAADARRRGFWLGEFTLALAVVVLAAALALGISEWRATNARSDRFIADLATAQAIFVAHAAEHGAYPADGLPGIAPAGLDQEPARLHWAEPTPIGGHWDWDFAQFGVVAGVAVFEPQLTRAQMARIDARIDDGNLRSGRFRERPAGYVYAIE